MSYLKSFGTGWGFIPDGDSLAFVDNHDNQRGHGAGGELILTYHKSKEYKIANGIILIYFMCVFSIFMNIFSDN